MKNYKIAAIALALLTSNAALAKGIEVSLSSDMNSITAKDDLTLNITFTNTESTPLKLLEWYIPTQETKESLFKVKKDGLRHEYFGAHAKRAAPQESDYIELQPHQSVSYQVELTGMYDLSATGSYDIQYAADFKGLVRDIDSKNRSSKIASNVVNVWIEGRGDSYAEMRQQAMQDIISIQGVSYTGACTNSEKSSIQSALSAANSITDNSVAYLQNESSNKYNPRYDTWFGTYSSSRWNTVRNHFYAIQDAIDNKNLTFDCSCNQGYYAYVYPTQPYKVYLCNAFWSAPTTGTDSKAGTIVHELSHFNVVAGTDDLAYGQSAAKSLANSSPSSAIRNADSHEYFAENTPYQY